MPTVPPTTAPPLVTLGPVITIVPVRIAPQFARCGAPANPWNYTFCAGSLITAPPSEFCAVFDCAASFALGTGYVIECADGTFSRTSRGLLGACRMEGGYRRTLYAP